MFFYGFWITLKNTYVYLYMVRSLNPINERIKPVTIQEKWHVPFFILSLEHIILIHYIIFQERKDNHVSFPESPTYHQDKHSRISKGNNFISNEASCISVPAYVFKSITSKITGCNTNQNLLNQANGLFITQWYMKSSSIIMVCMLSCTWNLQIYEW